MDIFTTAEVRSSLGRRLAATSFAAFLALGLVACGDDDNKDSSGSGTTTTEASSGSSSGDSVSYDITGIKYEDVTAPAGGTIEVKNDSGAPHTFTADDGSFDVEVPAGETVTVDVPAEPGDYPYHCEIHSSMKATLTAE